MRLHGIIGVICTSFSALVLAFNVFTPSNPDHVLNVAETLALTLVFFGTLWAPIKIAQWCQIAMFGIATFIAVLTDTGFFYSAVMLVSTLVLTYAYGGFHTMKAWKLPIASILSYLVCLFGVLHYTPLSVEAYARAAIWTLFVAMFLAFLWLILHEIRRQFFQDFAHELIEHNHDLLVEVRRLHNMLKDAQQNKRCNDGDRQQ